MDKYSELKTEYDELQQFVQEALPGENARKPANKKSSPERGQKEENIKK